ncbi:hypothetical protein HKX48_001457 [Thoreauomyces humboldtii]|nr:hypothetical protein HKX48_001457 [Thoreauomyces humboldtii]
MWSDGVTSSARSVAPANTSPRHRATAAACASSTTNSPLFSYPSPLRKRSTDIERVQAVAAIGSDSVPLAPAADPDYFPTPTGGRPMPLRRLSFGRDGLRDTPAASDGIVHRVKRTDTLAGVAISYRVSLSKLKKLNRIWNNDDIKMRDTLIIPRMAAFGGPVTPPILPEATDYGFDARPPLPSPLTRRTSSTAPLLPTVAEKTTQDFFTRLDADVAATMDELGSHAVWQPSPASESPVPHIGHTGSQWQYDDPSAAYGGFPSRPPKAPPSSRRGTVGSLEAVLGRPVAFPETGAEAALRKVPARAASSFAWIGSKLKELSSDLRPITPDRTDYVPVRTDD